MPSLRSRSLATSSEPGFRTPARGIVQAMGRGSPRSDMLRGAVEEAYSTFAKYLRPVDASFCTFCYDEREIAHLRSTDLRAIDGEHARRIAWESADHWDSLDLYKHYLPRILDALTPPDRCDDLYPEHLFEVLNYHQFARWPEVEKRSVLAWIRAVGGDLAPAEAEEWRAAADGLRMEPIELPAGSGGPRA
jgi:hypothetical protein